MGAPAVAVVVVSQGKRAAVLFVLPGLLWTAALRGAKRITPAFLGPDTLSPLPRSARTELSSKNLDGKTTRAAAVSAAAAAVTHAAAAVHDEKTFVFYVLKYGKNTSHTWLLELCAFFSSLLGSQSSTVGSGIFPLNI